MVKENFGLFFFFFFEGETWYNLKFFLESISDSSECIFLAIFKVDIYFYIVKLKALQLISLVPLICEILNIEEK